MSELWQICKIFMSNLCTVNSLRWELYQNGILGYKEVIIIGVLHHNYHLIMSHQLWKWADYVDQRTDMRGKLTGKTEGSVGTKTEGSVGTKNDGFWSLFNKHGRDENARIILCGNLKKTWRCGLDSADFGLRLSDGTFEHHSETSDSIRGRKFLV